MNEPAGGTEPIHLGSGSLSRVRFHCGHAAWLLYSAPCIAVWSVYLLSYFPGLMSPDSLDQWTQLVEWKFVDLHPPFHTLTNWLITRVWLSPAAVAIVQILALALLFGLAMRELGLLGVSRRVRLMITLLFSLTPVNGFMSIVLWKDVPYTISLVALWLLVLRIVRTRQAALASSGFLAAFSLLLIAVSLYRINGIPVAGLLLVAMGWLYKNQRARTAAVGFAWLAGFLFVKLVLYAAVGAAPPPPSYNYTLAIHQVVGLSRSTPLTPGEANFLDELAPAYFWKFYRCAIPNPAIYLTTGAYEGQFNQAFFASHTGEFVRLWLSLVLRNPHALFEHQVCLSNILWQIVPAPEAFTYTVPLGIGQNDLGLVTQSLMPQVQSLLTDVYEWSMTPSVSWWFWRPALYLFLALALLLFAPFEPREQALLLSIPLIQSLVLILVITDQNTRFQYPVYLIALIGSGLLFAKRGTVGSMV